MTSTYHNVRQNLRLFSSLDSGRMALTGLFPRAQLTAHAGLPPIRGEKWVATKWIHERSYQNGEPHI